MPTWKLNELICVRLFIEKILSINMCLQKKLIELIFARISNVWQCVLIYCVAKYFR